MHTGEKKCVKEYAMNSEDTLITIRNSYEAKGEEKITLLINLHYITSTCKEIVIPLTLFYVGTQVPFNGWNKFCNK